MLCRPNFVAWATEPRPTLAPNIWWVDPWGFRRVIRLTQFMYIIIRTRPLLKTFLLFFFLLRLLFLEKNSLIMNLIMILEDHLMMLQS